MVPTVIPHSSNYQGASPQKRTHQFDQVFPAVNGSLTAVQRRLKGTSNSCRRYRKKAFH